MLLVYLFSFTAALVIGAAAVFVAWRLIYWLWRYMLFATQMADAMLDVIDQSSGLYGWRHDRRFRRRCGARAIGVKELVARTVPGPPPNGLPPAAVPERSTR